MKRLLLLVLLLAPLTAQAQSPQDIFQQALRLERSQGDLSGAIALWRQVASDFGGDRALGAQALLRIGQAYEQLGETEAERAYRQIVAEFGDQAETVAMAREALGRLAGPAASEDWEDLSPTLLGQMLYAGRVSRDGRLFASTDMMGRLAYQKRGSSVPVYVDPEGIGEDGTPKVFEWTSAFSPDSDRLAYTRLSYETGHVSILLHDIQTRRNREIVDLNEHLGVPQSYAEVYDWTSDGQGVLIAYEKRIPGENGMRLDSTFLGTLDVARATFTNSVYLPLSAGFDYQTACLLEDRYALINGQISSGLSGVLRVDLVNGSIEDFWPHEANTRLLGCSNEAGAVAVRSDFFGRDDVYLARVQGGRAGETIHRIPDLSDRYGSVGMTDDGTLVVYEQQGQRRVELYGVSRDGREITRRSKVLHEGWSSLLGWPRVGGMMGHFTWSWGIDKYDHRGDNLLSVDLTSLEAKGINPFRYGRKRFSPDGSAIMMARTANQGSPGTFLLDLQAVAITDSLPNVYGSPGREGRSIAWAEREDAATMCIRESSPPFVETVTIACYDDDYTIAAPLVQISPDTLLANVGSRSSGTPDWFITGARGDDLPGEVHTTIVELSSGRVVLHWETPEDQVVVWENWAPDSKGILQQAGPQGSMGMGGKMYLLSVENGIQEEVLTDLTNTRLASEFKVGIDPPQILINTVESADRAAGGGLEIRDGLWELLRSRERR